VVIFQGWATEWQLKDPFSATIPDY